MEYKEGELELLHKHLYQILAEIQRVCEQLEIGYFIIGGSAIGALYDGAILPWDDDIDVGMERDDYERFITEAGKFLESKYIIQSPENEPNTPYYFAKVREDNTRFEGTDELGLDMHHGVYVDIFPMDRVPDNALLQRLHRGVVRNLTNAFVASTIELKQGGRLQKWVVNAFASLFGKRLIYRMLKASQRWFNSCDTKYINIAYMPLDQIERATLHPPCIVEFGELRVPAPRELESYLNHHYPNLHRHTKEEQMNHAPERFNLHSNE